MTATHSQDTAGDDHSRRLFVYNGGFLTQRRVRRILELAGWQIKIGKPGADDWVGVWGQSPTAPRGEKVAHNTRSPILRVEDSFLRSVLPGRNGSPPIGLNLDTRGVHFDSAHVSDIEHLLANHPLDDTALLNRARAASLRLKSAHLSKYNAFDPQANLPDAPYVLVIDQTRDDASISGGAANAATFKEMLVFAQTEHPGNKVVIKSHPETTAGLRPGHFGAEDTNDRVQLLDEPVSPWALMEGATAVYTVSSQMGFESIFAGHKPRVFGQPFYAGWGLTQDENPVARRERRLSRAQLFAAAMILYPTWYDPCRDRLCSLEESISALEAETRSWRDDHHGYVAFGMRLWKRKGLQSFFGQHMPLQFKNNLSSARARAKKLNRPVMAWASGLPATIHKDTDIIRIEDGFIRSRGLGAALVPALSMVRDDLGIYYDPNNESRLERLINGSVNLPPDALYRTEKLIRAVIQSRLSKYNIDGTSPALLPGGHKILVPGQVADDASLILGSPVIKDNLALLQRVRKENPDAVIVYKPHPDVEAGLRDGALPQAALDGLADYVLNNCSPIDALQACDEVWTMTSLLGFEAMLRDIPVTCLGIPFYAGWGLTRDLIPMPARRTARPDLLALAHACLIQYPRYRDPISGLPCPPEVVVERLALNQLGSHTKANRLLAKAQGLFSSFAPIWRSPGP